MNKWNILAGISFFSGAALYLFSLISVAMERNSDFSSTNLIKILGKDKIQTIQSVFPDFLNNPLMSLLGQPVYILLICAGILIFIINGVFRKN
ncbi:MAG: hypothetical protein ACQEQS_09915 [Thermodesulfobacteriota bacterium]